MKTFKDLEFEPHSIASHGISSYSDAKHAVIYFDNGYGVSVVSGRAFYTDSLHPYEVAVLHCNDGKWGLTYATPITDDVIGHCTERQVTSIMKQVQSLTK